MNLGIRDSRNHDLGQVVLGFDQVELGLVFVVIIAHVLVGDIDARGDFLVQHLVAGEGAAQVALEVVERDFLVLQALVEFLGGVGGLDFVELAIHFFVGGQQTELFGALHQDFSFNQLVEDAEAKAHRLLAGRLLIGAGRLVGVILIDFRAIDLVSVDRSHHVAAGSWPGTCRQRKQQKGGDREQASVFQAITILQSFHSSASTAMHAVECRP